MAWDVNNEVESQLDYLKNESDDEEYKNMSDDDIRASLYEDHALFTFAYACLMDNLTELLNEKNPSGSWKARVENFGWRNSDGTKEFEASTGSDFIHELLPNCDCTYYIHEFGKGLAVHNYHHDSPTGEWYYILPA